VSLQPPLVSVVLLTHNRPQWLAGALTSVIEGSFDDFEVIVSNNGNPEDTRQLHSVVADARVRLIEQDPHLGAFEHFVAALRLVRSRYVAVLHDDDWWAPGFLAALVPPLERHPEAVLAFADHYIVNQLGEVQEAESDANTRHWGRSDLGEGLHQPFFGVVAHQSVAITGCVFRRAALPLEQLTPEVGPFDDVWISYVLAKSGGAAYFSPQRLMYYRSHSASYTAAGFLSTHLAAIRGRRMMLEDPDMRPYSALISPRLAGSHVAAGAELLRHGQRREARSHLADAMRLRPTVKTLGGWTASWVVPSFLLSRL
jgi:glycosyltransferase involved in cell wall biosynthesis